MTIEYLKENNLILFEVIAGSKSFGLDTPQSDTDIKGVFYLPKEQFYGLEYIPQISNDTNDIVYYEIGRFIELLMKNNPNILEILATPKDCILYKHPIMERLHLKDVLSLFCKDTFAGYAATQIKKARGLKKKIVNPVAKEKKSLLDFCHILTGYSTTPLKKWLLDNHYAQEQCGLINIPNSKGMYALFYDSENIFSYKGIFRKENSNDVATSSISKSETPKCYMYFNKDAYSTYCKDYKEYWEWIDKRNEDRFNTNARHGKNYDSKNMMHTIRLLQSAKQIVTAGELNIRVTNREELLNIKQGNVEYDTLLLKAESLLKEIEKAAIDSHLPKTPNNKKLEQTLIEIRSELYT